MDNFIEIIKKIGEELDINVTLLSDNWTIVLEKNNQIHYIENTDSIICFNNICTDDYNKCLINIFIG